MYSLSLNAMCCEMFGARFGIIASNSINDIEYHSVSKP